MPTESLPLRAGFARDHHAVEFREPLPQSLEFPLEDDIALRAYRVEQSDLGFSANFVDVAQHRDDGCNSAASREEHNAPVPGLIEIELPVGTAGRYLQPDLRFLGKKRRHDTLFFHRDLDLRLPGRRRDRVGSRQLLPAYDPVERQKLPWLGAQRLISRELKPQSDGVWSLGLDMNQLHSVHVRWSIGPQGKQPV